MSFYKNDILQETRASWKMADSRVGTGKVQKESGTYCCTKRSVQKLGTHQKDTGTRFKGLALTEVGQI